MRHEYWLPVALAVLMLALTGAVKGESRSEGVLTAKVEAGRRAELRQELIGLREAYLKWARSETLAAAAATSELSPAARRDSSLESEYHRLQKKLLELMASPAGGARRSATAGIAELRRRTRGLVAALQAAEGRNLQGGKPGEAGARSPAPPPARPRGSSRVRSAGGSVSGPHLWPAMAKGDPVGWTTGLGLHPSSHEHRVLSQAGAVLAGLRRLPMAELCRHGWERRTHRELTTGNGQTARRDRLDAYSRLVPRLERGLVRVRDSAAAADEGARIAAAAERLLAALRPYGTALSGCKKSRGLCGPWQPPEASALRSPATASGALPGSAITPPANDSCATASPIGDGSFSGDTTGAGTDGEASCGFSGASPDVWYRYTAPATGTILFSTLGSSYDTVLSIHSGCPGIVANELACNDDWTGGQSQLSYDVEAGLDYLVRVSGFGGDAGAYELSVGPPGSLSGTVTDAATGAPLEWVDVEIVDHSGDTAGWGYTDDTGFYSAPDLPAGDYRAYTWASWSGNGYVDQLYAEPDNLPCPFGYCTLSAGTPIPVALGADTGGVDFPLDLGGSIAGSVRDASTGDFLEAGVDIYDAAGNYLTSGWTGGSPTYTAAGLPSGSHFAHSWNNEGYFNEIYDDLPCLDPWGCDATQGTPIPVSAPTATLGVDFGLTKGGTISGRLVDVVTGLPVGGFVQIYHGSGEHIDDAWPDELGNYSTQRGLVTGVYFASSVNWDGFVDELYDGIPCPGGCDVTAGTPINVTSGSDTGGVDIALKKQEGAIAGRVTDGVTGWPIANVTVEIYDPAGDYYTDGYTDEDGYYLSYGTLPAGTYYARTWNEDDYDDELWEEMDCSGGCDPTTGTGIGVTSYVLGIDFTLEKGGAITGQITDAATAAPLEGVWVGIYDPGGDWLTDGYTDASGNYISWGSLDPGSYYAVTYNEQGYFDQLYDGIDCSAGCDPTTGTEIVISSYATGIDFALAKGGTITGTVTDDATGAPLEGVEVTIYKLEPWGADWITRETTGPAGDYASSRALTTGSYFALTWNQFGYIDELYDVGYCVGWCDVTGGTPIAVTGGVTTAGVDFGLDRGSVVSGLLTDAATGSPIQGARVSLYDLDRDHVAAGYSDGSGLYTTESGLPSGSYFAITGNSSGHVNELYDDIVCAGCESWSPLGGTPIALSAPLEATGIDFALERGAQVTGNVFEQATGGPLGWCVWVDIYAANHVWVTRSWPDGGSGGWYRTRAGLPPGTYYALTENWCGYATEAWNGLACPWGWCELDETTPLTVSSTADVAGVDFYLDGLGSIAGRVTDAASGGPLEVDLAFFDASGRQIWDNEWSDPSTGDYSSPDDLCAGDYFVRTVNLDGFVDEVYSDIPCAGCDPATGTPVAVSGGPVGGVDFALVTGGRISGQVTSAIDGSPLSDVFVIFMNPATGWAASYAETDGSGMYTSYGGLTTGSYYVATENDQSHVDELYDGADGVACPGPLEWTWWRSCALTDGTPVAVSAPDTTPGIDFVLDAGGGIAGRVSWALTGEPIPSEVWIYDSSGLFIEEVWTDTGDYASLGGLPAGSYYAHTRNWEGYPDECYQDLPCPGGSCDPTLGTPIVVTAGAMTGGIDLALGSFSCASLPSAIDVTGWIDHAALFLACSEIRVWDCEVGSNGELELISGGIVALEDVSFLEGSEVTIRNQE